MKWISAVTAALLIAGASNTCFAAPEDVFAGTTKIALTQDLEKDPAKKSMEITDKAQIEKFVATINLKTKVPAACDHVKHAIFTTPKGVVQVNLCEACFDFGGKSYAMPAAFYALFEKSFGR